MGGSGGGVFLLEQPPEKGSLSLKHALFQRQLWKPMLPLEVLSAQVNTVCLSLSSACLLPAFLYTTFEMASLIAISFPCCKFALLMFKLVTFYQ